MDRRSLISGALGGAAGIVVGREVAPSSAGAAADVDRTEFDALQARVAWLEQFHDPMPPPHVPKFSGAVSLPAGFVVPFGEVWDFDPNVSTTVTVEANVVVAGTLQMRPANPGVVHRLVFAGVDEAAFVGGGMDPIETDVGLWVVGAGVLDAVGSAKTSWARAAASIPVSATVIEMAAPVEGWQVGDTVVVCPTSAPTSSTFSTEYDTTTIAAVSGSTVTLAAPTGFAHPKVTVGPGMDYGAEVLNLTRNVSIGGTAEGRSHGWITSSQPQTISYVEFPHMGPRKLTGGVTFYGPITATVLGRYPLHFHMCGDGSVGSVVTGCVAYQSGGRGFVPHVSHGVTFDACIAHDVFDEPFWWDQVTPAQATNDAVWRNCVASLVHYSPYFRGYRLAGFFLGTGVRNVCDGCVAVGVQGASTAAGFIWPEAANPQWTVSNPVAHNNLRNGFFVWQNHTEPFGATDFACFHNGAAGINHGAYTNDFVYRNGYLYGNKIAAVTLHALSSIGPAPLKFEGIRCDGAGYGLNVELPLHRFVGAQPAIFGGCEFVNHTGSTFVANPVETSRATTLDVVDCGPVSVTWSALGSADSVIRVQDGTTVTRYTPAGPTSIAPFSTVVYATPTPFPIPAAA